METKILKVVQQGEAFAVQSQKAESGQTMKCNIVLQEMGGSKYENQYAASMLGNVAGCRFTPGDLVVVALRSLHANITERFIRTSWLRTSRKSDF